MRRVRKKIMAPHIWEKNRCGSADERLRQRSVSLFADPKMKEIVHFVSSHQHEERLRAASASAGNAQPNTAGRLANDASISTLSRWSENEAPTEQPSFALISDDGKPQSVSNVQARLEWRDNMDMTLARLMQDTDFALDDRLKEGCSHSLRCQHLDKMYDWYNQHGMKEVRKEREAPPYLCFQDNTPTMPGSLRAYPSPAKGRNANASLLTPHEQQLARVNAAHLKVFRSRRKARVVETALGSASPNLPNSPTACSRFGATSSSFWSGK